MAALFLCLGYQLEKPLVLAIHFHGVIPSEAEFPEDDPLFVATAKRLALARDDRI